MPLLLDPSSVLLEPLPVLDPLPVLLVPLSVLELSPDEVVSDPVEDCDDVEVEESVDDGALLPSMAMPTAPAATAAPTPVATVIATTRRLMRSLTFMRSSVRAVPVRLL